MGDDKPALVSINDVFGLGKIAESAAAHRLIDAVVAGIGEILAPWRIRRLANAQLEVAHSISSTLPDNLQIEANLDNRSQMRIKTDNRSRQLNRESIAVKAIEDFRESYSHTTPEEHKNIDPDWVSYFWDRAETVSNAEFQSIWSRVLSRKAQGHSLSLRTLDMLRTLSTEEAEFIERLAQFKIAIGPDHAYWRNSIGLILSPKIELEGDKYEAPSRIFVNGDRVISAEQMPIKDRTRKLVGHTFDNVLAPIGIYSNTGWAHEFALNWTDKPLPIQIGDTQFEIHGIPRGTDDGYGRISFGHGIGFSQIGWEIFSLAKKDANGELVSIIKETLEQKGLVLVGPIHPASVK